MKDLLKVYLVDDEPLALKKLSGLLLRTEKVEIIGQTTEPLVALKTIPEILNRTRFFSIFRCRN